MVKVYNYRTVHSMPQDDIDTIKYHGLKPEMYTKGYADLGPANTSALGRFFFIADTILNHNLPLPPSSFIEMVVDQTTGKSKQDFRMTMDGKPGMGKSTSCFYLGGRYGIETADRLGGEPTDYFSMDNCVLLQDTDGVMQLLEKAEPHQCVVIDDAGVAAGSRDFQTQSNKNLNKIYQTCRTKRWFTIFNLPVITHIDLQIRELVNAKSRVYAKNHARGFNILKINESEISTHGRKNVEYKHRFAPVEGKKLDFYVAYSIEILDAYKGFMEKYDKLRDEAATRLICDTAEEERDKKAGVTKRDKKFQEEIDKHYDTIRSIYADGGSIKEMMRRTHLSEYKTNKILGVVREKEDGVIIPMEMK